MSGQAESAQSERANPDVLPAKLHRYSAKISFVLSADSLDEAHRMQQQIVGVVQRHTNERVMNVIGSMLDLTHRPDLEKRARVETHVPRPRPEGETESKIRAAVARPGKPKDADA